MRRISFLCFFVLGVVCALLDDYFDKNTRIKIESFPLIIEQQRCDRPEYFATYSRQRNAGFGSQMVIFAGCMVEAVSHGRRIAYDMAPGMMPEAYATTDYCGNKSTMECFFEPVTLCAPPASHSTNLVFQYGHNLDKTGWIGAPVIRVFGECKTTYPLDYTINNMYGQAICYTLRLNGRTRDTIHKTLSDLPPGHELLAMLDRNNFVAVHLRRGNKYIETSPVSLNKYGGILRKMQTRDVFLLTDDTKSVDMLKYELGSEWTIITLPNGVRYPGGWFIENDSMHSASAALSILAEYVVAVHAKALIGDNRSNIWRMLASIMVCSDNHADLISLD